ncbi:MAG: helix-turn-helix domain-containing protein [Bacteroidetes bacterium]|nr:MAG: helix-turn-helix domain-containing protein [Bacteroidota bacterium]
MQEIPLYHLEKFQEQRSRQLPYQVDVFDQNRKFDVVYPHRHDFYEILFITQGNGLHTIDFQEYSVNPPCLFFLCSGQIHSLKLSEDVKGFIFLFTSEFFLMNKKDEHQLLEFPFFYPLDKENPPLYLQKFEAEKLIFWFQDACAENKELKNDSEPMIRCFLDLILLFCKRIYPKKNDSEQKKGKILVKKFLQLIDKHYKNMRSVNEYAQLLHLTANHLNETVKHLTGRTATDLIREKVILEIKKMLIYTDLGVSEIAFQFQFEDQSYFSKYFKKEVGCAPMTFRKKS